MASKIEFNKQVEDAKGRIQASVEALATRFHLPEEVNALLARTHREPEVRRLFLMQNVADVLDHILAGVHGHDEAVAANSELPEDLPGRAALLRAGHVSPATVKTLSVQALQEIPGIGYAKAVHIHAALNPPAPKAPKALKPPSVESAPKVETAPLQPAETPLSTSVSAQEEKDAPGAEGMLSPSTNVTQTTPTDDSGDEKDKESF